MRKIYCLSALALLTACSQSVTEPADNAGKIMFSNTSTYLAKMLESGNRLSFVLIDDAQPGVVDSIDEQTSIANPVFTGPSVNNSGQPIIYFPFTSNALTSQYWIRYMRLDAGEHRFRLLDTLQQTLLDTSFLLTRQNPQSIFFADSATTFSAMVVEHDEIRVPDKARIKLVNLMPDARGGGVVVKIAALPAVTDSLPYLASTPYLEYPIPANERLYLSVFTKADTLTPLIQTSLTVQAGHSYLLITKGYTRSVVIRPPGGGLSIISANPRLDIMNIF